MERIDQTITLWINSHYSPFGDAFWSFMSGKFVWVPLYVGIVALLIWRFGWKKGLLAVGCIALCFFVDERIVNIVKHLVGRPRPCNDPDMITAGIHMLNLGKGFSFPSGHACNCFGVAVCTAICLKQDIKHSWNLFNVLLVTWAVLIAISRVMLARHFFGDVLVGSIIGITNAVLFACLFKRLSARFNL